jgi:(4-O-methyl)-D-glucuronate---lignin esterase
MKLRLALMIPLVLAGCVCLGAQPQDSVGGPDPREIPVPRIVGPLGTLPGVGTLPVRKEMPDVMIANDGAKVATRAQWGKRREEMKRILAYYAVGQMPPPPGNVKGQVVQSETVLDGAVKYRLVHLTFGPSEKLGLNIGIFTPAKGGPFPAIILQGGTPPGAAALTRLPQGPNQGRGEDVLLLVGPAPAAAAVPPAPGNAGGRGFGGPVTAESLASQRADVFRRGYALVVFNPNDCAEDTTLRNQDGSWAFRNTRFYPFYRNYDWGILAGWAWGASRVADYLERDPAIDKTKLIITGASRNGKSSMIAAAFDERLMGAPVVTGGGGVGAYRFAGPRKSETLDIMQKKYPNWFSPNLHEFWGQREKLPFDEHWFLALAAPRPFIALEGLNDAISLPEAVKQSMLGARPAYALFGAEDHLGVNYANHGHAFTAEDWTAMMDFFDKYALGKKVDRTFDRFPTEQELDAAPRK